MCGNIAGPNRSRIGILHFIGRIKMIADLLELLFLVNPRPIRKSRPKPLRLSCC